MYAEVIFNMIKKYGRLCNVILPDSPKRIKVYGIVNPLLYKNKMYLNDAYLADGYCDKGNYLYIGDPKVSFDNYPVGTFLRCGNGEFIDEYTIMKTEQYYIGNTAVYTWAVLQLRRRIEGISLIY